MDKFFNSVQSFVNSIRTSDHYASFDPAKAQGRDAEADPLASKAARHRPSSSNYVPGMRSAQMSSSSVNLAGPSSDQDLPNSVNGIPLTDLGPIPDPALSWERIDTWIESNYPELFDQLLDGATSNDLADLEHDLDCILPDDVKKSYNVHDGQERGGKPTGLFFGITFLDLESISEEWNVWRRASLKLDHMIRSKMKNPKSGSTSHPSSKLESYSWISHQDSCPADAVQSVYVHPGWIPLAKDWSGNNIAVDLAPGPKGNYGQVILFGRDFDTKYVIAPSWGDFLAQFAADLESGQSFIDDDIEMAIFAFKSPTGQLISYFNVLRQRVQRTQPQSQKHSSQRKSSTGRDSSGSMQHSSLPHTPVNSGRATSQMSNSGGSATSQSTKNTKFAHKSHLTIPSQLNDVDLCDDNRSAGLSANVLSNKSPSTNSLLSTRSLSPKNSAVPAIPNKKITTSLDSKSEEATKLSGNIKNDTDVEKHDTKATEEVANLSNTKSAETPEAKNSSNVAERDVASFTNAEISTNNNTVTHESNIESTTSIPKDTEIATKSPETSTQDSSSKKEKEINETSEES